MLSAAAAAVRKIFSSPRSLLSESGRLSHSQTCSFSRAPPAALPFTLSLCLFYQHQYVVINYCVASAAESKYSGRVTHQTGAVRGGCQRRNTSHTSTLRPTAGAWEDGVLALHPAVQRGYCNTTKLDLQHHLVAREENAFIRNLILCCYVAKNLSVAHNY